MLPWDSPNKGDEAVMDQQGNQGVGHAFLGADEEIIDDDLMQDILQDGLAPAAIAVLQGQVDGVMMQVAEYAPEIAGNVSSKMCNYIFDLIINIHIVPDYLYA